MERIKTIGVLGGDLRQGYLADLLADEGHTVIVSALDKLDTISPRCFAGTVGEMAAAAEVIILPMPASRDGVTLTAPFSYTPVYMSEIWPAFSPSTLVLGGMVKPPENARYTFIDYAARDDLAIRNAVPTAEAALEIAIRETDITLFGSHCLVVGYGRIGKIMTAYLLALHAKVTATARKASDLALISVAGATPLHTADIHTAAQDFDIIINTVPHPVLTRRELSKVKKSAVIIDLASPPFGVDFAAAEQLGLKAFSALSLPGKTAPRTAAGIIKDTITTILREENL